MKLLRDHNQARSLFKDRPRSSGMEPVDHMILWECPMNLECVWRETYISIKFVCLWVDLTALFIRRRCAARQWEDKLFLSTCAHCAFSVYLHIYQYIFQRMNSDWKPDRKKRSGVRNSMIISCFLILRPSSVPFLKWDSLLGKSLHSLLVQIYSTKCNIRNYRPDCYSSIPSCLDIEKSIC